MRYIVTGGAGFIGSHLVERLVADGHEVRVIDDFSTGQEINLRSVAGYIYLDRMNFIEWLQDHTYHLSACDGIFHLAANAYIPPSVENPEYDFHKNLLMPFLLLESMRKLSIRPRLIFASSAGVYGNPVRIPIREEDTTVPISPYGVSKLAAERYLSVYSQIYGLNAMSLRFFSVYGPRQQKQVVYDLFKKAITGRGQVEVFGDGTQTRDFIYVSDLVQALCIAMSNPEVCGDALNVASGISVSLDVLARAILRHAGYDGSGIHYTGTVRAGDAQKWEVDITKIQSLGFSPLVTLDDGLGRVYEWIKHSYSVPS